VTDAEGLVPRYLLTVTRSNGQVTTHETTATSFVVTGIPSGVTATATVTTLNPNNTAVASTATSSSTQTLSITSAGDDDADGMSNAAEITAGTNPLDASSIFKVNSIVMQGGNVTLTWQAVSGRTYKVESSTTLSGSWTTKATGLQVGTFSESKPADAKVFYRVVVE
jgi:hypothetical protein